MINSWFVEVRLGTDACREICRACMQDENEAWIKVPMKLSCVNCNSMGSPKMQYNLCYIGIIYGGDCH